MAKESILDKILTPVTNKLSAAVSESEFNVVVTIDGGTFARLAITVVLMVVVIILVNAIVKTYREKKPKQ